MKNLFSKVKNFCASAITRAKAAFTGTKAVLASGRAEGFVDTAVFSVLPVHD